MTRSGVLPASLFIATCQTDISWLFFDIRFISSKSTESFFRVVVRMAGAVLNIELLLSHTALVVASMYVEDDQALNYEVFKLLCLVHWRVSG